MTQPQQVLTWFELPTVDLKRAIAFYRTVLHAQIKEEVFAGTPHGIFERPAEGMVTGALIEDKRRKPATTGTLVYLSAGGQLDECLARVAAAGGKVVLEKTSIGPQGHIAIIADTEGNHVGLHQQAG